MVGINCDQILNGQTYRIAIIGLGPKGLYGLERLLTQLVNYNIERQVQVVVFNRNKFFGAGDIYRTDQPDYLIMNYPNHKISMVPMSGPPSVSKDIVSFSTWLASKEKYGQTETGSKYAPRSTVGEYLRFGFNSITKNLPDYIKVLTEVDTVVNIIKNDTGYNLVTIDGKCQGFDFQKILIATGHFWSRPMEFGNCRDEKLIKYVYPVNSKLGHIKKKASIAIKGLGLTFIDTTLALTEGRGGQFRTNKDGVLQYFASGYEPAVIYPFSRSGIPMVPRNGEDDGVDKGHYFTKEVVLKLKSKGHVNFDRQVLPLFKKEFIFNYYKVAFRINDIELSYHADFKKVEHQIYQFHERFPEVSKFSWDKMIDPFINFTNPKHNEILEYYQFLISEAQKGRDSAFSAAVGSWRAISATFNELYSYGGLDAESHEMVDSYYFGVFNRLAYGPPLQNVLKIMSLAKSGLMDFTFAKAPKIKSKSGQMFIISAKSKAQIDNLIDARIPRGNSKKTAGEFYSNLIAGGLIEEFCNGESYRPGCVNIDANGNAKSNDGRCNEDITFYGSPTEGVTFDNDTLSRKRNDFASKWALNVVRSIKQEKIFQFNSKEKLYDI